MSIEAAAAAYHIIVGIRSNETYTEAHSGDSSKSASLSSELPKVASLRLAAAEILEASGPPFGCFRLRSCIAHLILAVVKLILACFLNLLLPVGVMTPHTEG